MKNKTKHKLKISRILQRHKKVLFSLSIVFVVIIITALVSTTGITGKVTNPVDKTIQDMIQQQIQQRTKEITEQIIGGGGQNPGTTAQTIPDLPCDRTPRPRQLSSTATAYYAGPLIDAHVHMPVGFQIPPAIAQQVGWDAPVWDQDISKAEFICLLDKEKSKSVVGFTLVPNIFPDIFVSAAREMEKRYPGRVAPFITPAHLTNLDLTPEQIESTLAANPGLFKGLGEYGLYRADYKGKSPGDPYFLKIYDLAAKHKLIVMIHADEGQRQALERILQKYPQVKFLFHGSDYMAPYAAEIVAKYPNAYFTIDGDLWDIPNDYNTVNLYGATTKKEFIADFKRDYSRVQSVALARWKNAIEKNPDKFVWGTDRGKDWHFDSEVGALLEEGARTFIGQLDPSVQEKFAYKNAEKLLQR